MNNKNSKIKKSDKIVLPLLPLRDLVVFPYMVIPLFIGRKYSINALEEAINKKSLILTVTQRDPEIDNPKLEELYSVGTISKIIQIYKLPDDSVKILVEGISRAKVIAIEEKNEFYKAKLEKIKCKTIKNMKTEALMRLVTDKFGQYLKLNNKLSSEIISSRKN